MLNHHSLLLPGIPENLEHKQNQSGTPVAFDMYVMLFGPLARACGVQYPNFVASLVCVRGGIGCE